MHLLFFSDPEHILNISYVIPKKGRFTYIYFILVETTISQLGNHLSSEQGEVSSTADFASVYIKQDIDSETLSVWPRNSYSSVENQQENCLDEKPVIPQEEENFPLLDHLLPNAPVDGNLLFNVEPSFSEHFPGFKIQNCKNSSKFLQTGRLPKKLPPVILDL
jgi:hypothetical protein